VEWTFGEAEVLLPQAIVTVLKCHNFSSDRLIAIKILQEFPDALFHKVDVESILCDV
jgi:hypothetical protein